jgi:hypothetical protein
MKNTLQITLKDKSIITFDAIVKITHETTIKVSELLEYENPSLLLSIEHQQLNTDLELSKVSPFVLLYFDEDDFFTGAAYSINDAQSPFSFKTQFKKILLLPVPINFPLNEVYKFKDISIQKNNLEDRWHEHRAFLNGYGQFPYIILKTGHSIYTQIPIHLNKNNDFKNYPGTHLNEISKEVLDKYKSDKSSELHDLLIDHCKWMKSKIDSDRKEPSRICLVEGPEIGYYFNENLINFNSSIPNGGTLITQQNKIIAMNVNHYL